MKTLASILVETGLATSGKDAKRKIAEGAIKVDNHVCKENLEVIDWGGKLVLGEKLSEDAYWIFPDKLMTKGM